jgi:GNAT superfamily N-acetyltransferase
VRPVSSLAGRVQQRWAQLAGSSAEFTPAISPMVSPRSRICPPGWAGIVVIDGAALATAPDEETADRIDEALGGLATDSLTSADVLRRRLPIAEIRGPASLAYLDPPDFRPQPAVVEALGLDDPGVRRFLTGTGASWVADLEESGMEEITSPAFAIREHGQVVAAAGYRDWPGGTAHLSVLTAPAARGRGRARAAASAAVAYAIAAGKLPQWRARPLASRRVARALGFRELGSQVSIRLG